VNINVYVSNDGEAFVAKTATPFGTAGLTSSVINNLIVSDTGGTPNGAFVRFGIALGNIDNAANVRIIVSGRAEQNHL
jgi:hypothetical protein